jgi:hypothetical protein
LLSHSPALSLFRFLYNHISVIEIIFPRRKNTISNAFNRSDEKAELLPIEDILIVHYDEPKEGPRNSD